MRWIALACLMLSGCFGQVVSVQVRYHPSGAVEVATNFSENYHAGGLTRR